MGWLRLRVGPKLNYASKAWHLSDGNGKTLCGLTAEGRTIPGTPEKYARRCRLCLVIDRSQSKEEERWKSRT